MRAAVHADEIPIDVELVRRLIDNALPDYSSLELRPLAQSGSSNALYRLGDDYLARLPRQPGGSAAIEKEARWLKVIAAGLSVSVPRVLAVGEPTSEYPHRWSVTDWIEGDTPTSVMVAALPNAPRDALALDLAEVINDLREIDASAGAMRDETLSGYRGGTLQEADGDFRASVELCRALPDLDLDLDLALRCWDTALRVTRHEEPVSGWYHGDLLAENLLVRDGRLAAVLDFGGLAIGDPCVDLIVGWDVLDATSRETFRQATGVDDATWQRSMGWALFISTMTLPYYWRTMPARCASRRALAGAVLADFDLGAGGSD